MTPTIIKSVALVASLAITTASFGELSHAAEAKAPAQTKVNIRDLDLSTELGRQELSRRIRQAALRVCREENSSAIANGEQICFSDTLKRANAMVAARIESQHRESLAAATVNPTSVPKTH
jgi:UrcA family protein